MPELETTVVAEHVPAGEYNLRHFRTRHFLEDARRTLRAEGIPPGSPAPDFELPRVGGGALRLGGLRGKPVLLHFGSLS
jgi:hypothetical protein